MSNLKSHRWLIAVAAACGALLLMNSAAHAQSIVVNFDEFILAPASVINGSDLLGTPSGDGTNRYFGTFTTSQGATFNNTFDGDFGGYWNDGFAISNHTNVIYTIPASPPNAPIYASHLYTAHTPGGGGADGSPNYLVGSAAEPFYDFDIGAPVYPDSPRIRLAEGTTPISVAITNTTYGALTMRDGYSQGRRFGANPLDQGDNLYFDHPDYFLLTISGYDLGDALIGEVDFYLADFRFDDNSFDYIIDKWTTVDLTSLSGASSLTFRLESSDVGDFGTNTPLYFALDSLQLSAVPEPGSLLLAGLGACAIGLARRRRKKVATGE